MRHRRRFELAPQPADQHDQQHTGNEGAYQSSTPTQDEQQGGEQDARKDATELHTGLLD